MSEHDDVYDAPKTPDPYSLQARNALVPRPLPNQQRFGLRGVMILVALIALVFWLGRELGPWLVVLLVLVLLIALICGLIALVVRRQSTQREALLWVVATSAEKEMPIEPGVEACADLSGGMFALRVRSAIRWMHRGASPGEAFSRVGGVLPVPGLVLLRLGWDNPKLAEALHDLSRARARVRPDRAALAVRVALLLLTIVAVPVIGGFYLYWIMPQLEAIASEFDYPFPELSLAIASLDMGGASGNIQWLAIVMCLSLIFALGLLIWLFDPLYWGITVFDWFQLRRHGALVARALAGEVTRDRPMPESFEAIARAHSSGVVRRRLQWAARLVRRGAPWTAALVRVGFIRKADAAVLDAAQRAGNLPWALRDVADAAERRAGLRINALLQILFPATILLLGGMIGVLVVAFFLPLVQMIQSQS